MSDNRTISRQYNRNSLQRDWVLDELKKNGFRITNQRKLLIDIILADECSCCKEIYYEAVRQDPSIGIATVYRMVKTLEDIGAINRKNLYKIECDANCSLKSNCVLILENQEKVDLSLDDFQEVMKEILKKKGYAGVEKITSILWCQDNVVEGAS